MRLKVLRQIMTMSKFAFYALLLQCMFAGLLLADDVRSQSSSIEEIYVSVKLEEAPLKDVFADLETQTDFSFSYNQGIIDLDEIVTTVVVNESLGDVLRHLAKETKLNFKRIDNNIYVSKRKMLQPSVTETINSTIALQDRTITGKVTSAEDESELPGVSVVIKGTSVGTVTDLEGNYSLEAPESSIIVFSYVGFIREEVQLGNQSVINFVMTPDLKQLEEIVVVGYGTVKKSDLTGSVAQVKAEDINAYPSIGMIQSLQGRAAGVQIQQNNGEPGATFKVRVRGGTSISSSSEPLYVIDGFPGAVLPVPEDIASIEVLKDASATAIYGSRGANGVIMVTTKKGRTGKAKIEFNVSYSSQKEISRLDLLDKDQYSDLWEEVTGGPVEGLIGSGTDWQDEIFQTGQIQNYQLSFSGGTDNVDYYISGVYYDQKGVVITSNFKRFSVTSNLNIKASEKLNFGLNLLVRRSDKDGIRSQEGSGGIYGGVIAKAFTSEPTLPVYDDDGNYSISTSGDPSDNAVALARERKNEIINDMLQVNSYGEYAITKDLKFRINLGANINNSREGVYYPTTLMAGANTGGDATLDASKFTSLLNEDYLTYSKNFGNHDLNVMAGYSYQSTNSEWWRTGGQSFLTDAGYWWGLNGSSVYKAPGSSLTETALTS
ncbi:MAG: SusC/RagA family TonB-linked outer membrane protein, partial [Cyclobacteriaceae bacterium]|nr:SusC/RagA family TonB-linked outer membrane protein [Cyclobacteriaceae bacterium]